MDQHFNPRAHEGTTPSRRFGPAPCRDFNPRAHEGTTLPSSFIWYKPDDFNPRAHEGTTPLNPDVGPIDRISIHVPMRARPAIAAMRKELHDISIHVPMRARRLIISVLGVNIRISIHVPMRARLAIYANAWSRYVFQSTCP